MQTSKTCSYGTVSHVLCWSTYRRQGNTHQFAVSNSQSQSWGHLSKLQKRFQMIMQRTYSPGCSHSVTRWEKTHSKPFNKAPLEWRLAAKGEINSLVLLELSETHWIASTGTSDCPHSALIPPMYWILTPHPHIILITSLWNECCYLSPFHRIMNWCLEVQQQLGIDSQEPLGWDSTQDQWTSSDPSLFLSRPGWRGKGASADILLGTLSDLSLSRIAQLPRTTRPNWGYKYKCCGWSTQFELLGKTLQ